VQCFCRTGACSAASSLLHPRSQQHTLTTTPHLYSMRVSVTRLQALLADKEAHLRQLQSTNEGLRVRWGMLKLSARILLEIQRHHQQMSGQEEDGHLLRLQSILAASDVSGIGSNKLGGLGDAQLPPLAPRSNSNTSGVSISGDLDTLLEGAGTQRIGSNSSVLLGRFGSGGTGGAGNSSGESSGSYVADGGCSAPAPKPLCSDEGDLLEGLPHLNGEASVLRLEKCVLVSRAVNWCWDGGAGGRA